MTGQIILLKMRMGRFPAVDVVVPGTLFQKVCDYYYKKNEAISYIVGGGVKSESLDPKNAIYISDLEDTATHLSLLLVRGDPGRAIPGFVNPATRIVVPSKPNDPDSVPGASCHLVVSKQEIASGPDQGRYRMVMEKTIGIGRALARDFLSTLFTRYAQDFPSQFIAKKKRRNKKDGAETISYRPTLLLAPQLNGSLKKDLEEGRIGGFKLTRGSTKFTGEADEPVVQRLDVKLQARIAPTKDFSKVKRLVDHIQQTLNTISFESLNLELVDDAGQSIETTRTIDIDVLEESDLRYCKMVSLPDAADPKAEVYGSFNQPTKNFIIKCISDDGLW
jgi:hypothetical protein